VPVRRLIQVKIAKRFADGRVLGLLHRFLEFLGENIFFVGFLKKRVGKFVFALTVLLGKNPLRIFKIDIRPSLHRDLVRKYRTKHGVNHQLRLAARARHLQIVRFLLSHNRILRHFDRNGHRRAMLIKALWAKK